MDAATKKKAIDDAAAAATAAAHAATVEVIDVNVDALLCNWCSWASITRSDCTHARTSLYYYYSNSLCCERC